SPTAAGASTDSYDDWDNQAAVASRPTETHAINTRSMIAPLRCVMVHSAAAGGTLARGPLRSRSRRYHDTGAPRVQGEAAGSTCGTPCAGCSYLNPCQHAYVAMHAAADQELVLLHPALSLGAHGKLVTRDRPHHRLDHLELQALVVPMRSEAVVDALQLLEQF